MKEFDIFKFQNEEVFNKLEVLFKEGYIVVNFELVIGMK